MSVLLFEFQRPPTLIIFVDLFAFHSGDRDMKTNCKLILQWSHIGLVCLSVCLRIDALTIAISCPLTFSFTRDRSAQPGRRGKLFRFDALLLQISLSLSFPINATTQSSAVWSDGCIFS